MKKDSGYSVHLCKFEPGNLHHTKQESCLLEVRFRNSFDLYTHTCVHLLCLCTNINLSDLL
jgi:hypothetical protein